MDFLDPLGVFQHSSCRKVPKKMKGDPSGIFFQKKTRNAEKIERRLRGYSALRALVVTTEY